MESGWGLFSEFPRCYHSKPRLKNNRDSSDLEVGVGVGDL